MKYKIIYTVIFKPLLLSLLLTACDAATAPPVQPVATPTVISADLPTATPLILPTATPIPAAPVEQAEHAEALPNNPPVAANPVEVSPSIYVDNRSDAVAVLQSLFNAINRKEYVRAYAYWQSGSQVAPFDQFQQGYADTASVQLTAGSVSSNAGAGQFYHLVPVVLTTQTTSGETQHFAGCYTLHLANPAVQSPPFQSMGIHSAQVQQLPDDTGAAALAAQVCQEVDPNYAAGIVPPQPAPVPGDISASVYLDDRSDGVAVLRSLFNAINRHEYARAYGYWGSNSTVPPFDQFQQGYAETASIQLIAGSAGKEVGAGQIYYQVPTVLVAQTTTGETQTFAGCYRLHLANPGIQAEPPFQPLSIESANIQPAPNGADPSALLAQACPAS